MTSSVSVSCRSAISRRALGQRGRREVVGGAVLEVAGEVDRLADDHAPRSTGLGDVVVGGDDQLVELAAVVVLVGARLEERELVGAHDACRRRTRPRGRRRAWWGSSQHSERVAELAGAAEHAGGGDPGALGVELLALAEAGDDPAAPSACVRASLRKPVRASPDSSSAPSCAVGQVVGDALIVEDADRDRVGAGGCGGVGGGDGRPFERCGYYESGACPTP